MTSPKLGLLLALSLLLTSSYCVNFKGFDQFNTPSTADLNSCSLNLSDTVNETHINFEQTGNQENCDWSNLRFRSFFRGDELNDAVPFNAPVNGVLTASMDAAALQRNNGTGCVYLAQDEYPEDLHVCWFGFSQIRFPLGVYGTGNFTFAPNVSDIMFMNKENDQIVNASHNIIVKDSDFPEIVVDLHPECGSDNNTISHPATLVTFSTPENLTEHLFNVSFSHILVRKANSFTPGDYLTIKSPTADRHFMNGSESGCFQTALVYNSLLPNPDLSYCTEGCKMSFILKDNDNRFYLLQSNGIVTVPFDTNATNGGNTGAGVGTGGFNNETGGPVASSGMTIAFNLFMVLLFLFAYLQ